MFALSLQTPVGARYPLLKPASRMVAKEGRLETLGRVNYEADPNRSGDDLLLLLPYCTKRVNESLLPPPSFLLSQSREFDSCGGPPARPSASVRPATAPAPVGRCCGHSAP